MVQLFKALGQDELAAFRAFAEVYPDDCLLLVDTINTLESGMPNAIKVFEELRRKGHEPVGIRIDSGDLAYLSIQAAQMLNQAGFPDTSITLSSELDEMVIWQIQTQIMAEAPRYGVDPNDLLKRLVYGVGTHLITSEGQPALGGVFKLVAVQKNGQWEPAIKLSDTPLKTPNPGHKDVWRIYDKRGMATADLLTLTEEDVWQDNQFMLRHPADSTKYRLLRRSDVGSYEPLLTDILKEGKLVYTRTGIEEARARRDLDLARLDEGVKRLIYPHIYHVSLSDKLWNLKQQLIREVLEQDTPGHQE
jgi:nicotinate phosphoribosyltransferase